MSLIRILPNNMEQLSKMACVFLSAVVILAPPCSRGPWVAISINGKVAFVF